MNAKEFASHEPEVSGIEGWYVDSKGDVWQTTLNKGCGGFGIKDSTNAIIRFGILRTSTFFLTRRNSKK
jgi:ligand-binding sensor domain-containing protein